MLLSALLVVAGITFLYYGGELLVGGAIGLAKKLGLSPLVIGLTVVAFATSCPELAATITASLRGGSDLALGNIVGSNIANIGLILGTAAMLTPISGRQRQVRHQAAYMILVTVLFYPLLASGRIVAWHGLALLAALAFYLITSLRQAEEQDDDEPDEAPALDVTRAITVIVIGLGLLVGGAQALVAGATDIARTLGVPERVIGLTLLALGTSLPELAASFAAVRRRQAGLVLGNVIGSNIFNLLCIVGLTTLVRPIDVAPAVLELDYWVMLGSSLVVALLLATRQKILRVEGATLFVAYLIYVALLFR